MAGSANFFIPELLCLKKSDGNASIIAFHENLGRALQFHLLSVEGRTLMGEPPYCGFDIATEGPRIAFEGGLDENCGFRFLGLNNI
jgi:hypothetical protein